MNLPHKSSDETPNSRLFFVHPRARIGKNPTIEPFVTIQDDVVIGDNVWIGACACIMSGTRIGDNCRIFPGAIIGAVPQDLKFAGEYSTVEIGDSVTIREYCTINRGTKASYKTVVGNDVLLMAYVHVAHDCIIGDHAILANNVNLGGHIEIGEYAILGGLTAVHQFVHIGEHSLVSGGSLVGKDVPPFVKAGRNPLSYIGINAVGLKRRGFLAEDIHCIEDIYRILFVKKHNVTQALQVIESHLAPSAYRDRVVAFVTASHRGIMKGFKSAYGNKPT